MECSSNNITDTNFIGLQFTDSNNKISIVPKEIVQHIFSFLSEGDLIRSAKVCRLWNRLSNLETFWKPEKQNILDDFQSLVIQGVLSWKDAKICSRFSDFLKLCKEETCPVGAKYNFGINIPSLERQILAINLNKNSFIKYGNYCFSVISPTQVRIDNKGQNFVFEINPDKLISAIQVEDDFLFVLRQDGIIIQWNYKTKKIVQEIETAITEKRKELEKLSFYFYFPYCDNFFYVKNKLIHIKYNVNALEIISYTKKKFSQFFTDEKLFFKNSEKRCIQQINFNNDVYLLGLTSLWKGNLKTNDTALIDLSDSLQREVHLSKKYSSMKCMTIDKNYFFGLSVDKKIIIVNLENKKFITFSLNLGIFTSETYIAKITVFHNLLYCFRDDNICVFDLNKRELIHKIPCLLKNNSDESEIIKELVTVAKKHSKPLVLPIDLI